jgi:hypothetical protein
MLSAVGDKDDNWTEFLEHYDLLDERMTEEDAYLHYRKFSAVEFPETPPSEWKKLYHDLLPFERGLVFGDAIGEVVEFEFKPEVISTTPIKEKPIPYSRTEREWIREYLTKLEELGVVKKLMPGDPEPLFTVGVVLVKEG